MTTVGWERIETRLARDAGRSCPRVIPYVTVGYPTVAATLEIVPALEEAGAVAIELGVPFSDPLADGPTIQRASFEALRGGVTLARCLEVSRALRERGVTLPIVLMGYYNPLLAYGLERVARDASEAGVDGFIVPDLPMEEAGPFLRACAPHTLAFIPLLAPTSTEERIVEACRIGRGFIYCVNLLGVTGARRDLPTEAASLVETVRRHTRLPVAVGFGVSTAEHLRALSGLADVVVVGSALLDAIGAASGGSAEAASVGRSFLRELLEAAPATEGSRQG